jgi:hypothetical protein
MSLKVLVGFKKSIQAKKLSEHLNIKQINLWGRGLRIDW